MDWKIFVDFLKSDNINCKRKKIKIPNKKLKNDKKKTIYI